MSTMNELVLVDLPLFTPGDLLVDATTLTEKAQKALDEGIKLLPSSRKTWVNTAFVLGLEPVSGWVHEPSLGICAPGLVSSLARLVDSENITELFLSGASGGIFIAGTPEEVAMTLMGATMDEDDYDDEDGVVAILDIPSEVM
jgi:hypothetical protein